MAGSRQVMDEWNAQLYRDGRVELRRRGWRTWVATVLPVAVAAYFIWMTLRSGDRPAWVWVVTCLVVVGDIVIFVVPVVRFWTAPQPGLVVDAEGLHVARPAVTFAWADILGRDTPDTRPRGSSSLVLAPGAADRWRAVKSRSWPRLRGRPPATGGTTEWNVANIYGASSADLATWLADEVRPRFTSGQHAG